MNSNRDSRTREITRGGSKVHRSAHRRRSRQSFALADRTTSPAYQVPPARRRERIAAYWAARGRGADVSGEPTPTLSEALDALGPVAWEAFLADWSPLAAGAGYQAEELIRRARVVAVAKRWCGDPLADVWTVAVDHLEGLRDFALITAELER